MSHQFKPGDLALIVSKNTKEANVGRAVRIIESMGFPKEYIWEGNLYVNTTGGQIWLIEVEGAPLQTRFSTPVRRGPICDYKLMPLRGDFAPEQAKSHEVAQS